ncbi:FCD domain-containing protein [Pseudodesulfovibrio sp. zrk46]|uniref:FadR/GntR family transcriptional regulator n=1 Tax=Pseudodesulfovibrio sp. zrk46 TaxID=2725288 RepID=UPI001449938D|nr:FCD domain-containing protein [Pseudodesulfovibrio sp. zrk46]QJB55795.1 FadR family transcriptional regulator [Pseudodesulfovibrio sp. zrk46]
MAFQAKKLKQSRRFQQVVDEVEAAILAGELVPGDQLPPELELKEMFGTGRGTVREALRVLEEKGLIEIRAGAAGGAFVTKADPAKLTEHLDLLVQARSISPEHIREFREAVEPVAASLAAGRVTSAGVDRLNAAFHKAEQALDTGDSAAFLQGDVAVHVTIAELTGNPLLTAVLKMVHEHVLGVSDNYALKGDTALDDNLEDLRGLVQAVADGRGDEAGQRAMEHVRIFHGRMTAAQGD